MKRIGLILFLCVLLFSGFASGSQSGVEHEVKGDLIEKMSNVMSLLEKVKKEENKENAYLLINDGLKDLIAFRRIAARVMGKYARYSTKEERDFFVESFKKKLFAAYIDTLKSSGEVSSKINEINLTEKGNRGSVKVLIKTESGERVVVNYSIFKDSSKGWMIENLIFEGVNIGLAFRDSFYQEVEKNRGDVSKSIKNWNINIEKNAG